LAELDRERAFKAMLQLSMYCDK